MKTLFFLLVLAVSITRLAQAQNTQLVIDQAATMPSLATPGSGSILDLAEYTDAQGNTYQAGSFTGTVHFGSFTFTGLDTDVVVAKRNAAGVYQWALAGGGAGTQRGKALAVDAAGNVFLTGSFPTATATFGATVLTNRQAAGTSTSDVFAAKVTAAGAWDWAVSAGGGTRINGDDYATAITVDLFGNAYVAGTFTSSVAFFGTIQVPNPDRIGGDIVFVAKLSSGGVWQWVSNSNGPGNTVRSLVTEPTGATYLSGECSGYISYGPFLLLNPGGKQVQFVAKLDPAGTWTWLTKSVASRSGAGSSQHFRLVLDDLNSAYMTGVFTCDTLKFGSTVLTNTGPAVPPAYTSRTYNAFVAKLNVATGQWRWAVQSRGNGDENLGGPLFDAQGHMYVGGSFSPPPGGGGAGSEFGTTTLVSAGSSDIVVAQLDTAGRWLWARRAGGPDDESGAPRRIDAQGRVYVAGSFYGNTLPLGALTLAALPWASGATAAFSVFEARLGANGPLAARADAAALFEVYPNPAHSAVTVTGLLPGQPVQVFDLVGRRILGGTVPPRGDMLLALPAGLPTGVYLVRAGAQARRLVVE